MKTFKQFVTEQKLSMEMSKYTCHHTDDHKVHHTFNWFKDASDTEVKQRAQSIDRLFKNSKHDKIRVERH